VLATLPEREAYSSRITADQVMPNYLLLTAQNP
jgi:hypothetical protein